MKKPVKSIMSSAEKPSGGRIGARFFERLVAGDKGRAFLLNFLQSTEESDEGVVFDALVERVGEGSEDLQKLVKVHRADEERHAEIFRRAVKRMGAGPEQMPPELFVVGNLDQQLGNWTEKFIRGDEEVGVLEMYSLLLVIEERAVREWPAIVSALRRVDPAAANDVQSVINDEQRHVKYAAAICRRYAKDEESLFATVKHVRKVEARVFEEHTNTMTRWCLDNDLLSVNRFERAIWEGLARMSA
jgi:hypothetical protein